MPELPQTIEYANPAHHPFRSRELRRVKRLLLALVLQPALILAYAWGGAAWAQQHEGQSELSWRATGTDAYIYWLIDVPRLVAPIAPVSIGVLTCVIVMLTRWRASTFFILIACVAAWFATTFGLFLLRHGIDP
jgi:hypothetical protein